MTPRMRTSATNCAAAWVLVAAFGACQEGSPCKTGTWRATLTRPRGFVASCSPASSYDGPCTLVLTLTVVQTVSGGYLSSVEHTPIDPATGQSLPGYVQRWNGVAFEDDAFTYRLPGQEWVDCNGTRTARTVEYGVDATVSSDCSEVVGTAWTEPADPCEASSGRWEVPITFENVAE